MTKLLERAVERVVERVKRGMGRNEPQHQRLKHNPTGSAIPPNPALDKVLKPAL